MKVLDRIEISKAVITDLTAVAGLFNSYRVFYGQAPNLEMATKFLSMRLANGDSVIFVAKDKAESVGFVQLYPSYSSVSMKPIWILNDLFVSPTARQHGIGRALMNKACDFAVETGAKGLSLETTSNNLIGQKLYESLGYRKDETLHYFLEV